MSLARPELELIGQYTPGMSVSDLERELGVTDAVKLSSNENPLGPSPFALMELEQSLVRISEYPDANASRLRGLLAGKLHVPIEKLIVGNGSNEIMEMVTKAFLRPSETVVTSDLTFSLYARFARLMGGILKSVPLKDYCHDLDVMLEVISSEKTRIVFLANPNNPTGNIIKHDELVSFLKEVSADVIVVLDEAYAEYADSMDYPDSISLMKEFANLVSVRTFSKAYGLAGLRIGYGIADKYIIDHMRKTAQPFNTSLLAQLAASAALCDKAHLHQTLDINIEGRRFLSAFFNDLNIWHIPTQANFIFFTTDRDAREVFRSLLEGGVIIRHIKDSYLRVSIGTMEQNKRFANALRVVLG